jgi:hypothetical protein
MMEPMYDVPPDPLLGYAIIAVGIVGLVLGFAIIRWITRDPEDGSDHWRYRRH